MFSCLGNAASPEPGGTCQGTCTFAVRLALSMWGLNSEDVILSEYMNYTRSLTRQLGKDRGREDTRSSGVWPFCSIRGDISICKRWVYIF